jgi:ABC-2 type transport system ATP-binding protein
MVRVDSISKYFGQILAVDNLSFEVKQGEVLGFLGPNGAGKSTTMKMITGFLWLSGGKITVCDHDVAADPLGAKRCIGYLPEGAPSYEDMSVRDFLFFVGAVREMGGDMLKTAVSSSVERLELGKVLDQRIGTLSKGFKRRVGLAQSILHDPKVLILDEPTDGLDPNQKHQVRSLINELSRKKTLIISTHILEEVTAVCTRAIIINEGKLIADERPSDLVSRSRWNNAVRIRLSEWSELRDTFSALAGVAEVEPHKEDREWVIFPDSGASILEKVQACVKKEKLSVENIYVEHGQLDDVFRTITRGQLT